MRTWIMKLILGKWIKPLIKLLDGRKTLLGLIQLILGLAIWVVPQAGFGDSSTMIINLARIIAEFLDSSGIDMGSLLISGAGFTLVGVIHKIKKIFGDLTRKEEE